MRGRPITGEEFERMLEAVPKAQRQGFVVNPLPVEFETKSQRTWFMLCRMDLERLIGEYRNCSAAKACGGSEQTVRDWRDSLRRARSTRGSSSATRRMN
jgi:hypothetical protein